MQKLNLSASLDLFELARALFMGKRFEEACKVIKKYRENVQYDLFPLADRRPANRIDVSIVVVSYNKGRAIFECLDSLFKQSDQGFEVILVDQGGNEEALSKLENYPILHVSPSINLLPSEGRNIGAHFARGKYIVFLDDDALIHSRYVENMKLAMQKFDFLALRGRVLPKENKKNNKPPNHYDLGHYPLPALLTTEGNMAIRKEVFEQVRGFNPLLFGCEGNELSYRCLINFPGRDIYYWPGMIIYHDFAIGEQLQAKRERQALAREYQEYIYPGSELLPQYYQKWYNLSPIQRQLTNSLKNDLMTIKNSGSYKAVIAMREALRQPLRKGPLLPWVLIRMLWKKKKGKQLADDNG
jgi:glycosyltransferase involved in cell wall biosynthesis